MLPSPFLWSLPLAFWLLPRAVWCRFGLSAEAELSVAVSTFNNSRLQCVCFYNHFEHVHILTLGILTPCSKLILPSTHLPHPTISATPPGSRHTATLLIHDKVKYQLEHDVSCELFGTKTLRELLIGHETRLLSCSGMMPEAHPHSN